MVKKIVDIFFLLRPRQWIKNLFVFTPFIFSGQAVFGRNTIEVLWVFILFCLLSSACYAFNDVIDVKEDRKHPIKKRRPVAAGKIKRESALATSVLLAVIVLMISFHINHKFTIVALAYLLLNVAYSIWLKHSMIIDLFVISTGFLLRVYAGAMAIHVSISSWLMISIFMLAFFLGAGKRRGDVILSRRIPSLKKGNSVILKYSKEFLNDLTFFSLILINVTYLFYTVFSSFPMLFSVVFVLYGTLRYWYLLQRHPAYPDPTDFILRDRPLLFVIVLWGIYVRGATWLTLGH